MPKPFEILKEGSNEKNTSVEHKKDDTNLIQLRRKYGLREVQSQDVFVSQKQRDQQDLREKAKGVDYNDPEAPRLRGGAGEDPYNKQYFLEKLRNSGITNSDHAYDFLNNRKYAQAIEEAPALREALEEIIEQDYKNRLDRLDRRKMYLAQNIMSENKNKGDKQKKDGRILLPHITKLLHYTKGKADLLTAMESLKFIYQNFHTYDEIIQGRLRNANIPGLPHDQAGPSGS